MCWFNCRGSARGIHTNKSQDSRIQRLNSFGVALDRDNLFETIVAVESLKSFLYFWLFLILFWVNRFCFTELGWYPNTWFAGCCYMKKWGSSSSPYKYDLVPKALLETTSLRGRIVSTFARSPKRKKKLTHPNTPENRKIPALLRPRLRLRLIC